MLPGVSSYDTSMISPLRTVRVAAWTITVVMITAIVIGLVTAEDGAVAELLANVWARVTIIDLYATLGLISIWIVWRERSPMRSAGWVLGVVLTGSVAVGVYVALAAGRARTLTELLCGDQDIVAD